MRRDSLQLLCAARSGDLKARHEVGRRYLLGFGGFQRHVPTGIDYLRPQGAWNMSEAAIVIADALSLKDILQFRQEDMLGRAAAAGCGAAQVKLGALLCCSPDTLAEGLDWLERAAVSGQTPARRALGAVKRPLDAASLAALLKAALPDHADDARAVAMIAARDACAQDRMAQVRLCLLAAQELGEGLSAGWCELASTVVQQAQTQVGPDLGMAPAQLEACLDLRMAQGDVQAAFSLGRALCGMPCGAVAAHQLVPARNLRKGLGALLRAADGGCRDAWLYLYRVCASRENSVANPHAARFYLERAAAAGQPEAQRKLGALLMREADKLEESEVAMALLHQAASSGDAPAAALLRTFVLPLPGADDVAGATALELRRHHPCLGVRLELSRAFGLTRLEALSLDPVRALRPWGLALNGSPDSTPSRRVPPRAVPAVSEFAFAAMRNLQAFFGQSSHAVRSEGDFRRRSLAQRRHFEQHGLDPDMFFASASSSTLATLRVGSKWAYHARSALREALAD